MSLKQPEPPFQPAPAAKPQRIMSNAAWLSLDAGIDLVAGTVCSILVARTLGPERLGQYAYALALVNLTGVVAALGAPLATRRYMAEYLARGERGLAHAVLRAMFTFQTIVAVALTLAGLTWITLSHKELYLVPAILSLVPGLLRGVVTGALLATEDARWTVRASMISTMVHLTSVLVVLTLNVGVVGLTSALFASRLVDLAIRSHYVRRHVAAIAGRQVVALPPAVKQRLIRFSWQATILLILEVFVWNRWEVLLLERFSTIEMVAFFSISFGAAQGVILVSRVAATATGMTLMAESGRDADRVGRLAADVAYFMALLSVPLAAVAAGLASPLIELFYGPQFAPAAHVLAILAAFTPFRAVFFAGQYLLLAKDDQRPLIYASTFGALVDVFLGVVLIPVLGALGAGFTKALTMAATTIATWYLIGHRHNVRLRVKPLGALLAIGIVAGAAMHVTARPLPAWAAIPVAMALGVALLAIGMRFVGAIDARTRDRLLQLQGMVPTPFNKLYVTVVARVATG